MTGKRRTESDGEPDAGRPHERSAPRQRAFELFAAWLERHDEPRELDAADFTRLLEEHPEVRDELRALRDGLAQFRSIRPSRLRAALDERPPIVLRTWLVRVAAAAVVVAAAGLAWRYGRGSKPATVTPPTPIARTDTQAPPSPLATAIVARGVKWLEEAVRPGCSLDHLNDHMSGILGTGSSSGDPGQADPGTEEVNSDALRGMAQAFSILGAVAGESSPSTAGAAPPALAHVTDALRAAPVGSWRRKLLDRIESVHDVDDPSKPFLLALNQDPELGALIAKASGAGMPSEAVAQVVAKITNRAILSVRAIDLENDGQEVTGATVYGQPIDLPVNTLGKRVELGKTPLQMKAIECGEWRITVVDSSGLEVRFSELRFLASPGENLGRRVAFLRTTSEVIEGMALREPCVARVGTPPDAEASQLDSPDSTTPVAKLWIDRCEVTCAEYSKFYLDLLDHPAWFDGRMPIHRPRVLAADGSCPPNLVRRAIVDVAWEEASLYANWAGKRLPTEVEWERVARGDENENRKYPWGSTFDAARINTELSVGTHPLVPVMFHGRMGYRMPDARHEDLIGAEVDATAYDSGSTPESSGTRVLRMADNVQEFVEDLFFARATGATTAPMIGATVTRVVKGSSWIFASEDATINWRRNSVTTSFGIRDVGLRCLKTAAPMVEPR